MSFLDKLLFWRKKTVEFEGDIHGCFTLPGAELDHGGEAAHDLPITHDAGADQD